MTSSNVQEVVLSPTDTFLVQRQSIASGGFASTPSYTVTALDIGLFASEQFDKDIVVIKQEFEDLQNQMDMVINDLITTIKTITTDHDIRIMVVEDRSEKNSLEIDRLETRIDDALAKTKLFLYHRLLTGVDETTNPGEMLMKGIDGEEVDTLMEVRKIEYNLESTQNIANIFVDETLEITAQKGVSGDGAAFSHRAIYKITGINQLGGDRVELEVLPRNAIGNLTPVYQVGLDNLVRSDIYPVFTISKEEYEEGLEKCYKKTGGTLTGDVVINKTNPKFTLQGGDGQIIFDNKIIFKDRSSGNQIFKVDSSTFFVTSTVNVNNNKIINLADPVAENDAATKSYVDSKVNVNDVTTDDLFKPGNRVAERSSAATEALGFFYESNALYFKV